MSIASELQRILNAKAALKTALESKGLTVAADATLDSYATLVAKLGDYDPVTNGHAYVDLGLTSRTLWATCNVGASTPEEYGGYYAWGETSEKSGSSAYDSNGSDYVFGPYDSEEYDNYGMTKYNIDDTKVLLDETDDVAHVIMGGSWKLPTEAQLQELKALTSSWKTVNGVAGMEFVGNNGNTLFIPAAGAKYNGSLHNTGNQGWIWSNNVDSYKVSRAVNLHVSETDIMVGYILRFLGLSARGVLNLS